MSLKLRYGSSLGFLFLIFTIIGPCLSLATSYKCLSSYSESKSVYFGILLRKAETLEELEFLNKHSAEALQFSANADPESHMVNSLIFYRRSYELNLETIISKELYNYILSNSKVVLKTNSKYQFFKSYLEFQNSEF